jgi:hypothetical protein
VLSRPDPSAHRIRPPEKILGGPAITLNGSGANGGATSVKDVSANPSVSAEVSLPRSLRAPSLRLGPKLSRAESNIPFTNSLDPITAPLEKNLTRQRTNRSNGISPSRFRSASNRHRCSFSSCALVRPLRLVIRFYLAASFHPFLHPFALPGHQDLPIFQAPNVAPKRRIRRHLLVRPQRPNQTGPDLRAVALRPTATPSSTITLLERSSQRCPERRCQNPRLAWQGLRNR